ncbi:hypothetical protein BO94DRAFT_601211, partial [Aspergillus sclerotioniger CBS 115572]
KEEALRIIIQNSSIRFIYLLCLKGFPRVDTLYRHFREQQDDTHAGLAKRKLRKRTDNEFFLTCYQESVRASMAPENIPPGANCFEVNFVVKHFDSSRHIMATSARIEESLRKVIQNSPIRFICPLCLKGFHGPDPLYHHLRKQQQRDDTHAGLAMRDSSHLRFVTSYRESVRISITARDISRVSGCFSTAFVVEHC